MQEKMCDWCEVSKASTGRRDCELYCSTCDPYAWAAFVHPETYEENKRIALTRVEQRLAKAEEESKWEEAISNRDKVVRKDLLAARVAFGVMFLIVLVAVAGIYLVGGQC